MTVERRIFRVMEDTSPEFTMMQECFICPVVSTGCSCCFPPWCIRHAAMLTSVLNCAYQTQERPTNYGMLLRMMSLEELIKEATTIGVEIDGYTDMAANASELLKLWHHHCGDINQVIGEAKLRWVAIPLELRLVSEMVRQKEDRLLDEANASAEEKIRKHKQPREDILI